MVYGQLLALIWWIAGCWRIYYLIRFFQIEEYNNVRFLRWESSDRAERRYLLRNLLIFAAYMAVGSVLYGVSKGSVLTALYPALGFLMIIGAAYRPADSEVKRTFARTPRGVRLLIVSFIVQGLITLIIEISLPAVSILFPTFNVTVGGLIAFFFAPIALPAANILLYPVEEAVRQTYVRSARAVLDQINPIVIAITGSYGKTSTKEYITHLLGGRYRVFKTPKSYNTLMGVCKAINQNLPRDQRFDYFIVEAGAYMPGEIAAICKMTRPSISLVTAVGPMHLERFGTLERTAQAKYEIIQALPPDGMAVFNDDDTRVKAMHDRGYPTTRIGVTRENIAGSRFSARNIQMTIDGLDFDIQDAETGESGHLHAPLFGDHNVSNILMAIAVGRHAGISLADLIQRATSLQPAEHRLVRRVLPNGVITIDDAYSANPVGTRQALAVLNLNQKGRRIVLTSGMVELGSVQDEENRKLGMAIAAIATDVIVINSKVTNPLIQGLADAKFPRKNHFTAVDTTADAIAAMTALAQSGDAVLIMADLPDTY